MTNADTVDAAGSTDAPAIVLLHGSVVSRQMWLPQLRGLSQDLRVIAPDLPGHGARADEPFSLAAGAQTVADLIVEYAHGRALVAGLSLGGYVAIELARRHPERVAGLVLSGASINCTGTLGVYLRVLSGLMRRGWLEQSRDRAERRVKRLFPPGLEDVAQAQLDAGVFPEALGASFAAMAGTDFVAALADYPGPMLILNGAKDRAAVRGARAFVTGHSNRRIESIEGAGHACSLDRPAEWNAAVGAFAARIGWTRGRSREER